MTKKQFVSYVVQGVICVIVCVLIYLFSVVDRSEIHVVNDTGENIKQVTFNLIEDRLTWNERFPEIEAGKKIELTGEKSDLVIRSIEFYLRGNPHKWESGSIAVKGETVVLRICADGTVSGAYDSIAE